MSILEVSDIGIGFGGLTALDGVGFSASSPARSLP